MDLHRSKKPDWERIDAAHYTWLQGLAASSGGLVTVGNLVTVVGFSIVLIGMNEIIDQNYWLALSALIIGRFLDVVDGWAADLTQTKSPLGELLDAGLDKVGTIMTIVILYSYRVAPWWILLALALPHICITTITFISIHLKKHLHPSTRGKISMATAWLSLLGFVSIRGAYLSRHSILSIMTYTVACISIGIGLSATIGYLNELRHMK
jgi:phosphatidylglycerophosphate synthase